MDNLASQVIGKPFRPKGSDSDETLRIVHAVDITENLTDSDRHSALLCYAMTDKGPMVQLRICPPEDPRPSWVYNYLVWSLERDRRALARMRQNTILTDEQFLRLVKNNCPPAIGD